LGPFQYQFRFHFKETLFPCRSCLVSGSIRIHRPQRCAGSASAAGSRLVSSRLCPPGSRESASDKAWGGLSCLVSCPAPVPPKTSCARATASHRDSALGSTPGCSHTTDAEITLLRSCLHGSRWQAFCSSPTLGSATKNCPQNKNLFPKDVLLLLRTDRIILYQGILKPSLEELDNKTRKES
jgi:hypothetical protein